jgi:hypothetical protein
LRLLPGWSCSGQGEGHRDIFDVKGSINTSKEHTVAATKMELAERLSKAEGADVDWLREGVRVLAQVLMEADVSAQIGAEHGQRTPDRTTHRARCKLSQRTVPSRPCSAPANYRGGQVLTWSSGKAHMALARSRSQVRDGHMDGAGAVLLQEGEHR